MRPDDPRRVGSDAVKRMPFESVAADWRCVRDPAASARANPVLRAPGLPKLVTKRLGNGHWACFKTRDAGDNGTAIDFMLNRGLTFADIRARFGAAAAVRGFRNVWNEAVPDPAPDWLAGRGIRRETLDACRPLIRRDGGGGLLFAHRDRNRRLAGFEIGPPDGARRFATGGTRSLFAVRAVAAGDLEALVIAEGAVDALSLAQIDGCPAGQAFLSTAGAPSRRQCEQIGLAAPHPPQRQVRRPDAGRRRGRGPPGRDPARKAEAPAPRHVPEATPARERLTARVAGLNPDGRTASGQRRTPSKTAIAGVASPGRRPKARQTAEIPLF